MSFKYQMVRASSPKEFCEKCKKLYKENWIFIGQLLVSKKNRDEFIFTQQWIKNTNDSTVGDVDFVIIEEESIEKFADKCSELHNSDYIFTSQVIPIGMGEGKFVYIQQWVKRESDEIKSKE